VSTIPAIFAPVGNPAEARRLIRAAPNHASTNLSRVLFNGVNRRRPSRTSQTHSGSAATIQWFAPVNRRNGEANVTHRFSVIKLHALELVDRNSPVAPGGIINQNAVPHYAPKYDEVIVAQGVDCHHERRPLYQVVQIELTQTPIKSPPR
jgi:hypothetical protein